MSPEPSESPVPVLALFGLAGLAAVIGGFFMLVAGPKDTQTAPAPDPVVQQQTQPAQPVMPGQPPQPAPPPPQPEPAQPSAS